MLRDSVDYLIGEPDLGSGKKKRAGVKGDGFRLAEKVLVSNRKPSAQAAFFWLMSIDRVPVEFHSGPPLAFFVGVLECHLTLTPQVLVRGQAAIKRIADVNQKVDG